MHKKWKRYSVLCIIICTLLAGFPVSAAITYSFVPLNIEAWVESSEEGPELKLWVQNNTNRAIRQFMFSIEIYNGNGETIADSSTGVMRFYGSASDIYLPELTNDVITWDLSSFAGAVSAGNVVLETVRFMNGQTWTYDPWMNYSYEPDFKWENEIMADGSVEMYYDHSVHLFDTSLGSTYRDWYIWSDAENRWVWFSNEMAPDCYVWNRNVSIKLVINGNHDLYEIKSFQVAMSPFIIMRHMDENDENTNSVDKYALDTERTFVQAEGNWNVAFWDENEYGQARDWYIWDEATQTWVWFSGERGPAYKVSQEGTYTIRLVYDGNSEIAQEISFTAVRPAAAAVEGEAENEAA